MSQQIGFRAAVSWAELVKHAPELAAFGERRLDGKVSYLATVTADQRPRLHPVTPVIGKGHCFLFVEPSTAKARDLEINGFYSLHCAMNDSSGSSGEFLVSGNVQQVESEEMRVIAESVSSYRPASRAILFELLLSQASATEYRGGRPSRKKWRAQ